MPDAIKIRPIESADASTVLHLVNALNAVTDDPPVKVGAETVAAFLEADRLYGFLAQANATAIGFVIGEDCITTDVLEPGSYMSDLYVHEDWRGQGVGRRLVDAFAAEAEARGGTHIWWASMRENHTARRAYRAYGAIEDKTCCHALTEKQFAAAIRRHRERT